MAEETIVARTTAGKTPLYAEDLLAWLKEASFSVPHEGSAVDADELEKKLRREIVRRRWGELIDDYAAKLEAAGAMPAQVAEAMRAGKLFTRWSDTPARQKLEEYLEHVTAYREVSVAEVVLAFEGVLSRLRGEGARDG